MKICIARCLKIVALISALMSQGLVGAPMNSHPGWISDVGLNSGAALGSQSQPTYDAVSDRVARPKPPLPSLGPAGFRFIEPTFGTRILRVTDPNTRPDKPNRAYHTPSSAEQTAWNADGTVFYVEDSGNGIIPFSFDSTTMTASRMGNTANNSGGLVLSLRASPAFSFTDPKLIYGIGGSNNRTIRQYDFQADAYTDLLNLDTLVSNLSGFTGDLTASANERFSVYFGGPRQDSHFYILVLDKNTGARLLLDTLNSTVNGQPLATPLGWYVHNARIDKSGRYVLITRADSGPYVWDTESGTVSELNVLGQGHRAAGFGKLINHDGSDRAQWQLRSLDSASLGATSALIVPQLSPTQRVLTSHLSWCNSEESSLVPVLVSTYRSLSAATEWRAFDDEIIAVRTDGIESAVWRFAHHRSVPVTFWDTPRGNVSQQGRFFMFTSNWERTLGDNRQDVFIVELARAGDTRPPVISDPAASSITESGAEITWATDEVSDSQVEYGATPAYGSSTAVDSSPVTAHRIVLSNLAPDTLFYYRVKSRDASGNIALSGDLVFRTAPDTAPPLINSVTSLEITSGGGKITWATDEAADSEVEYGTTTSYGSRASASSNLVTSHSLLLTGLSPDTLYHYRVLSKDSAGNLATSGDFTFTTAGQWDVVWVQIVNCTASGNLLQKTSGRNDSADAGAVSQQVIASGDGYLEFTIAEVNRERWCGLSKGNTDTTGADIDFGIKLTSTGIAAVRENNVYRKEVKYVSGDVFRIAVEGGVVKYYKNGALIHTSANAPAYPLLADTAFVNRDATIKHAVLVKR